MPTIIENIKFYTVTERAGLLRITPQTVRAYIKQGKLRGNRIGQTNTSYGKGSQGVYRGDASKQ
jgi:excisionase family DNA binding protein